MLSRAMESGAAARDRQDPRECRTPRLSTFAAIDRRAALAALAAGGLALLGRPASAFPAGAGEFAQPDLADARVLRFVAGLRPYRRGGIRLERERIAGREIVHHYGHGGAGVTLSWGGAEAAADLVAEVAPAETDVAVLGAGAVGLATARVLQERGYRVRLLARDFPPHTTSDVAGAEWQPFGVDAGATAAERARFARIARRSHVRFAALEGREYGVYRRPHFAAAHGGELLQAIPEEIDVAARELERFPIAGVAAGGTAFDTYLIEPPVYLARLLRDVLVAGARVEAATFAAAADAAALPEPVVVDCLGLGAGAVFRDPEVVPIRGQLVHLFPEPLEYLLSHQGGYLFPRGDAVVLGGTYERGVADEAPQEAACRAILERHRRFFGA